MIAHLPFLLHPFTPFSLSLRTCHKKAVYTLAGAGGVEEGMQNASRFCLAEKAQASFPPR